MVVTSEALGRCERLAHVSLLGNAAVGSRTRNLLISSLHYRATQCVGDRRYSEPCAGKLTVYSHKSSIAVLRRGRGGRVGEEERRLSVGVAPNFNSASALT